MAAASYRQSSPIIGYSGHLPGAKFHVGSNLKRQGTAYPRTQQTQSSESRSRSNIDNQKESTTTLASSVASYKYDTDGNPVSNEDTQTQKSYRSSFNQLGVSQFGNNQNGNVSPVFQIPVQFVHAPNAAAASLQIPVNASIFNRESQELQSAEEMRTALSGSRSMHNLADGTDRVNVHTDPNDEDGATIKSRRTSRAKKRRSKSAASKKRHSKTAQASQNAEWQNTELNGLGNGWWSEGQALRNLRRHRENAGLPPYTAADELKRNASTTARSAKSGQIVDEGEEDGDEVNRTQTSIERLGRTPAPGYTGHLIEMHHLQIGKNFTDAAKESRKLQQSYRDSLNGSFMSTRSHSPRKRSPSVRNVTRESRRSQN